METTSGGGDASSAQRRRSSPTKTKGRGSAAAVPTVSSPTSKTSDLHRSQSHEPRHTPPLFLIPSATVRETADSGRPSAPLSDPGGAPTPKQMNADDQENDDSDRRSTSSAGRDTVVQLNYGGTTDVVVDGGKSISGGGGDDPGAGKTSPGAGAMSGGQGGDGDGDAGFGRCRSPLDALAGCQAAWLGGIELAQDVVHGLLTTHRLLIQRILLAVVLLGFAAYLVFAVWKSGMCTFAVIVFTILAVIVQSLRLLKRLCGQRIDTYIIAPVRQVHRSKPCIYLTW